MDEFVQPTGRVPSALQASSASAGNATVAAAGVAAAPHYSGAAHVRLARKAVAGSPRAADAAIAAGWSACGSRRPTRDDERVGSLVLVLEATPGWRVMTVQEVARRLVGGLGAV